MPRPQLPTTVPHLDPDQPAAAIAAQGSDPLLPLVQQAARGEREALARLLSLIAPSIVAAVKVVAGRDVDVEDAAQEAMIAIVDAVPRFRGQSTFLHYARRIAVRTAFGMRRAGRRRSRNLAEVEAEAEPLEAATTARASQNAAVERSECVAAFQRLLDELPEGQAESLTYRVLLEYPLPVIAQELKVPVNTVRSRIRLARDHLRERILADPALGALLKDLG